MHWPDFPDASPLGDGRVASAVDRPTSVEELQERVIARASESLAIYPRGGKTALDYGGIPRRPGVALDVTGLNQVIDYPAADMTITVQAGITLARLQEVLAVEGQFLPLDAPFAGLATLGGIFATNTCGPRRLGWGRPRDMIIGVSFVSAEGKVVKGGGRVVKNVAGYDFPKLLTGSMGTLGVITQMTLKVRPKPEASSLVVVEFATTEDAIKTVKLLNTSATRPVAIELLNASGARLVGLPKSPATLVLAYEDNKASVTWQIETIRSEVQPGNPRVLEESEQSRIWSGLTEFAAAGSGLFSLQASLRRSEAAQLVELPPDRWAVRVHAGSGIVQAHSVGDEPLADREAELAAMRVKGGSLEDSIVTRCPTDWKTRHHVWGPPRADWSMMERIKAALDPAGVMNPGRFVGTI